MTLEHAPDGSLVLREYNRVLRWTFGIAALAVPAVVAGGQFLQGEWQWKSLVGAAAGSAGLALLAAVIGDLRVRFDATARRMTWEHRNGFRTRRVSVPFSEIRDAFVLSSTSRDDDDTVGGYRVRHRAMVRTATDTLPLSLTEGPQKSDYEALCAEVLALLTRSEAAPVKRTPVEQLMLAGRLIDAVALIRAERGVSLTEARAIAAALREKLTSSSDASRS